MQQRENMKVAKHLVVGLGATGLSIVRALKQIGVKTELISVIDSRENPPNIEVFEAEGVVLSVGGFLQKYLDQCDYLWVSPGVSIMTPELQKTIERLPVDHVGGDIELLAYLLERDIPLLAITGTNGKSTVTTQVGAILEAAGYDLFMGGNLGKPALDLWIDYQSSAVENPCFLLELSSFQLETTQNLAVNVGAILNISPDHLDRYRNYAHYVKSKIELFNQSAAMIVGVDIDPLVLQAYGEFSGEKSCFSLDDDHAEWYANIDEMMIYHQGQAFCSYQSSRLGGSHNLLNIIASVAITATFGIERSAIELGIANYNPLPHRSVLVREYQGVKYYNDSKATNIASTEAAIRGFKGEKWLILGGVGKGQDFSLLNPALLEGEIKGIYLIGKSADMIASTLPPSIPSYYIEHLELAVDAIAKQAVEGDIVLFSPACASFDQYANFETRGDHFVKLVSAL